MEFLAELWLPIVLSAVFVFIASSILHMVIPIHKGDYRKLPAEEKILDVMRIQGVLPGQYTFPCADSMKDMCTPEMMEKYKLGPCGMMTVMPSGVPKMGKSLILWFLYSVIIGIFVAYVTRLALEPGATYRQVFRVAGTVAVLGYAVSYIPDSIWKGLKWSSTIKYVFDGVVYGLLTAGTFGWLWPDAA
jgi:hypothetical protein